MITTEVVCDSIGERSPRLTTFLSRYPKFIHGEHLRHRSASFCVSSSRAVPVSKNLEEVRSDELRASPVWWGREQKGMSAAEELSSVDELRLYEFVEIGSTLIGKAKTPKEYSQLLWKKAALEAAYTAQHLYAAGAHKSIVNRVLEPFLHVNVLWTICEPGLMNFSGLRLDQAAQPEMRVLAEQTWKAWNESRPQKLKPGEWHLPFIKLEDTDLINRTAFNQDEWNVHRIASDLERKISVARCARLSYTSFETGKRSTIEEDLKLYDRLITSRPIHASPAEHQATPDQRWEDAGGGYALGTEWVHKSGWQHPEQHGNLPGWRQYRKTLPGEAVAELPEAYW